MMKSQRNISTQLKIDLEDSLNQLERSRQKLNSSKQFHHQNSKSYEFGLWQQRIGDIDKLDQQYQTSPNYRMESNKQPLENVQSFCKIQDDQNQFEGENQFSKQLFKQSIQKPDTPTFKQTKAQGQQFKYGEVLNSENISEGVVYNSKGFGFRKSQSKAQSYDFCLLTEQQLYQQVKKNPQQTEQTISNNISFNKQNIEEEINRIKTELSNHRKISETITSQINQEFLSSPSILSNQSSSIVESEQYNFENYDFNLSNQKVKTDQNSSQNSQKQVKKAYKVTQCISPMRLQSDSDQASVSNSDQFDCQETSQNKIFQFLHTETEMGINSNCQQDQKKESAIALEEINFSNHREKLDQQSKQRKNFNQKSSQNINEQHKDYQEQRNEKRKKQSSLQRQEQLLELTKKQYKQQWFCCKMCRCDIM